MQGPALLIVDPQVDFHEGGSLGIDGANEDAKRISAFINQHQRAIDHIYVTLDSHHIFDISHPSFWQNNGGQNPTPFDIIKADDIESGKWYPVLVNLKDHCLKYCKSLESRGRLTHTIWPPHCLIGTPGHSIHPDINIALQNWSIEHRHPVTFIHKGENILTEQFSAFKAEMPLDNDSTTQLNVELLENLKHHSKVIICGQSLSHCVNYTTRDLVENWPKNQISQLVLLVDGCSTAPGYEQSSKMFLEDMKEKGVIIYNHMADFDIKSCV